MTHSATEPPSTTIIGDGRHVTAPRGNRQAFHRDEYDARVLQIQDDLVAADLDVLLVHTPENICYLTGYETSGYFEYQVLAVPASGTPRLLVRHCERFNVDEYTHLPDAFIWCDGTDYFDATARLVESLGAPHPARVGLESHSWFVTAQVSAVLTAKLHGHKITEAGRIIERRRLVKSPAEQAYIRAAAAIADRTMAAAVAAAAAGRSEQEIAAAAYHEHLVAGGEYPALPHYLSSGDRCYLGHAHWTEQVLKTGDLLHLELLGVKSRYHAGLIRTVHIGRAPANVQESASVGLDIQDQMLSELRPGGSMSEITYRCRQRIADAIGDAGTGRLGYSMGIGFPPSAGESQTADFREGSPWELRPGMVFHMLGGISSDMQFSDTVLITDDGWERLTQTPRELFEV